MPKDPAEALSVIARTLGAATEMLKKIELPEPEADALADALPAYVTIRKAATLTGLSEKAIRKKIEARKWREGREYRRSPDGRLFISIEGYKKWVEGAR